MVAEPRFKLPHRTHFTDKVIPAKYDAVRAIWWKARRLLYPLMCKLVRKYFAFVATSVPSERLFNASGNVIVSKRNRLTPENADKLIFLHENS